MTEDEAKTKRCCGPEGCGDYIHKDTQRERYCIASECMAWQATDNECTNPTHDPNSTVVYVPTFVPAGYCGLAQRAT